MFKFFTLLLILKFCRKCPQEIKAENTNVFLMKRGLNWSSLCAKKGKPALRQEKFSELVHQLRRWSSNPSGRKEEYSKKKMIGRRESPENPNKSQIRKEATTRQRIALQCLFTVYILIWRMALWSPMPYFDFHTLYIIHSFKKIQFLPILSFSLTKKYQHFLTNFCSPRFFSIILKTFELFFP